VRDEGLRDGEGEREEEGVDVVCPTVQHTSISSRSWLQGEVGPLRLTRGRIRKVLFRKMSNDLGDNVSTSMGTSLEVCRYVDHEDEDSFELLEG
jgi:hypothetical protein